MTKSTKLVRQVKSFATGLALDILIGLFWVFAVVVNFFRAVSMGHINFKVVLVVVSIILTVVSSLLLFSDYPYAVELLLVALLVLLVGVGSFVFRATKLLVGVGLLLISK